MFTKNRPLVVGLAASGLLGLGMVAACLAQAPTASPRRGSDSPSVPHSIILLTDGRLLRGPVNEDDSGFTLLQKGGTIHFRRKEVVKVFSTLAEVYEYKVARIPPGDPDEQMMLAKWCLQQGLKAEAVDRLKVVLDLNPSNRSAENMLAFIEVQAQRQDLRDQDVVRTQALAPAMDNPASADKPNAINDIMMMKAVRDMGALGTPVIFNLPPAVAAKRYQEFSVGVQRVLIKSCVKCHDERYQGDFKLIDIKSKRDENHLTYKTNLDATLRLVDPSNPAQSPLLTNSLLPHGPGQKPILRGYNDVSYQILAAWVKSIVVQQTDSKVSPASGFGSGAGNNPISTEVGFGQERVGAQPRMPARTATAGRPGATGDPNFADVPSSKDQSPLSKIGRPILPALPGDVAGGVGKPDAKGSEKAVSGVPAEIPPEMIPEDVRNAAPLPKAKATNKFKGKVDPALLENMMRRVNQGSPGG